MNQSYHYFVVKTLASFAGFEENAAQKIAHFSQQIDDFILSGRIILSRKPPEYFLNNNYAMQIGNLDYWLFVPCPTGIDMLIAIQPEFQRNTILPFHFIPSQNLADIEKLTPVDRNKYRCVSASSIGESKLIINGLIKGAVDNVVKCGKTDANLMRLGMALHTYADTHSHNRFSGLNGWENKALFKNAANAYTHETISLSDLACEALLPIGHANANHIPDICDYRFVLDMKEHDGGSYDTPFARYNKDDFKLCSRAILDFLCDANGRTHYNDNEWESISAKLDSAEDVQDETDIVGLIKNWKKCFAEEHFCYHYERNEFFPCNEIHFLNNVDAEIAKRFFVTDKDAEDIYSEKGNIARNIVDVAFAFPEDSLFFAYNQIACEWVKSVTGNMPDSITVEEAAYYFDKISGAAWKPQKDIAYIVDAAGFLYDPTQDIIYSTLFNLQRRAGYCNIYDQSAGLIGSVIDCEPIIFEYNGYEWMIELWKGQYGLETGCEIGVYKRKAGNFSSPDEHIIDMYDCVPDSDMLKMSLSLIKNSEKLFSRGPEKHWWLTGFKCGVFSEPEDLRIDYTIEFPDEGMRDVFISKIKTMGYAPIFDSKTVNFTFIKPYKDKSSGEKEADKVIQAINQKLCESYNSLKAKHQVTSNDPNIISEILEYADSDLHTWFDNLEKIKIKGNANTRARIERGLGLNK